MNNEDKQRFGKIICYGIIAYIAYKVLTTFLPFVVAVLSIVGAGFLWVLYEENRRR